MGFPWKNWTTLPFLSLPFEIFLVGFIIHVILCAYCGMLFMIIIIISCGSVKMLHRKNYLLYSSCMVTLKAGTRK